MSLDEGRNEVEVRIPEGSAAARLAAQIDRLVAGLARHWLALFNTMVGIFFILPFLAPVFMQIGLTGLGHLIYVLYTPFCHQLPERSFFLFGPQVVYTVPQLEAAHAVPAGLNLFQREFLRWPGSPEMGYKVAVCERDNAIYGAILLAGLAFVPFRAHFRRLGRRIPKLRFWAYALMLVPIAVDGFTQLFGWRESDWLLRTITGTLFGLATVWLAYPYIQEAMEDVESAEGSRPGRSPQPGTVIS